MKSALVLGAGMVGSAMARDLAALGDVEVTVADASPVALAPLSGKERIAALQTDLRVNATALARGHDVVLGALPSVLGFETLRSVILSGKPYVDVSFMAEDALELDDLAKEHRSVVIVDCGVSPGISNVLSGHAVATFDEAHAIEIYVGGLPALRKLPWQYKAAFAPHDVIEIYLRPARIVEHGREVVRAALSEPELIDLPGVGTVEAFNTDGLRSLSRLPVPFMKEKTLRWPGHVDLIRALRDGGFFSPDPIVVKGAQVIPREISSALLFPQWTYEEGEVDLTILRVVVTGSTSQGRSRLTWDLLDTYDPVSRLRSMSRTTAFPATVIARLLLEGAFSEPGVHAPERLGTVPSLYASILDGLSTRGIHVHEKIEQL
ncbi:MAG: saccharopine dehydrogenase NADP-binding domain-containing protein [Deltaproteobacteria bacterium]|nr:saccharopine dehydrogenase NADP-binding domain-containing protein [Deltaproteobacteria bacterium]